MTPCPRFWLLLILPLWLLGGCESPEARTAHEASVTGWQDACRDAAEGLECGQILTEAELKNRIGDPDYDVQEAGFATALPDRELRAFVLDQLAATTRRNRQSGAANYMGALASPAALAGCRFLIYDEGTRYPCPHNPGGSWWAILVPFGACMTPMGLGFEAYTFAVRGDQVVGASMISYGDSPRFNLASRQRVR
jgi:hypothetical protein